MKRQKNKVIGFGLIVAVWLFFSSCTLSEKGIDTHREKEEVDKEMVTLKVVANDFFCDNGIQNNVVMKEIEKIVQVRVDYETETQKNSVYYRSSGNLPDIWITSIFNVPELIEKGYIFSLDELLEIKGMDIIKNTSKMLEFSKKYLSVNRDKVYCLPTVNLVEGDEKLPPMYQVGYAIRWDLYKQLGCPDITSQDKFLTVLKDMQNLCLANEPEKTVYAFSGWNNWNQWWPFIIPYMLGKGKGHHIDDQKNVYQAYMDIESPFWEAIEFMNKANRMGLVDPMGFNQTLDNWMIRMKNMEYLTVPANWWEEDIQKAMEDKEIENGGYVYLPGIDYNDALYMGDTSAEVGSQRTYVISSQCKNPEKAMEFINFLFSMEGSRLLYSGIENIHWYRQEDKALLTARMRSTLSSFSDWKKRTGVNLYTNMAGLAGHVKDEKDGYELDIIGKNKGVIEQSKSIFQRDVSEYLKVDTLSDYYSNCIESGELKYSTYDPSYYYKIDQPDEVIKVTNIRIEDYLYLAIPELILCDQESEFIDMRYKVIEELKLMGGENWEQFYVEQYRKVIELQEQ